MSTSLERLMEAVDRLAGEEPWPQRIRMTAGTLIRTREAFREINALYPEKITWSIDGEFSWVTPALFSIPVVIDPEVAEGEIEVDVWERGIASRSIGMLD